jgi:hypothetical protein
MSFFMVVRKNGQCAVEVAEEETGSGERGAGSGERGAGSGERGENAESEGRMLPASSLFTKPPRFAERRSAEGANGLDVESVLVIGGTYRVDVRVDEIPKVLRLFVTRVRQKQDCSSTSFFNEMQKVFFTPIFTRRHAF